MEKLPTAQELGNKLYQPIGMSCNEFAIKLAIEFAKLHVKAALEAAVQNTETSLWQNNADLEIIANRADYIINHIPIKDSILNAYPLENIK